MRAMVFLALTACLDPTSSSENSTSANSYEPATLTADVTPASEGLETIRASVAEVTILDAKGSVIATAPAYEAGGSRDEVLGIRVFPQAYVGAPVIAVTTTVGGHRESTTYVALYAVQGRQVATLFEGPIEVATDDNDVTGSLLVLPATVMYRAPGAEIATLLSYDAAARRYVAR